MVSARDVALYFLQSDRDGSLFSDAELMSKNGRNFYAGNARLNKYLHLAQNIYYAKTSELLFNEPIYAYDNGGVVPDVQENYKYLLAKKEDIPIDLPEEVKEFLSKLNKVLHNASIDKLIELSHEDPEWKRKNHYFQKEDQKMDTAACLKEYQNRYADIVQLMDRMSA